MSTSSPFVQLVDDHVVVRLEGEVDLMVRTSLTDSYDFAISAESKNPRDLTLNHYQTFGREPFDYLTRHDFIPIELRTTYASVVEQALAAIAQTLTGIDFGVNNRAGTVDVLGAVVVSTTNGQGTFVSSLVNKGTKSPEAAWAFVKFMSEPANQVAAVPQMTLASASLLRSTCDLCPSNSRCRARRKIIR